MPESKKRGGKKAHNKRIKARNEKMKGKKYKIEVARKVIKKEED